MVVDVTSKDVTDAVEVIGRIGAGAAITAGAALVPGVKQLLTDAAKEIEMQERQAAYRSIVDSMEPDSRQLAALQELGINTMDFPYVAIEPIRKRPLKPKPRGRDELVERRKKARYE